MSIVDKLASVASVNKMNKVTTDIVTHASDIHRVSLEYSWADLTSAAGFVGASAKVANQGLSLVRTVTGAGAAATPEATETGKD
ncbi:hypothetical protein [Actinophytocola sp. NPDC049390]|uniref:hypothetical protein n=1 Tax=Actinophytocola sp. NPDC049390 TaxID=3363894 RepID=UPI00379CA9B7